MIYVFIACLTFGIAYAGVSLLLGSHGHDHGGADYDGIGEGGLDAAEAEHATADSADVPSPFSPLVIASAIATFGGVGIIGKVGFGMSDLVSSIVALTFSGLIGAAIFFGIVRFMYRSQSNSTYSLADLVGNEAEVITPVPEKGIGEIACVINGIRHNLSAKSFYGKEIARGAAVSIRDIQGNVALVTQKMTIDQYGIEENEEVKTREKKNN